MTFDDFRAGKCSCEVRTPEQMLKLAGIEPPLGVEPVYVWLDKRIIALQGAIDRYEEAGLRPSESWWEEMNALAYIRRHYDRKVDL